MQRDASITTVAQGFSPATRAPRRRSTKVLRYRNICSAEAAEGISNRAPAAKKR